MGQRDTGLPHPQQLLHEGGDAEDHVLVIHDGPGEPRNAAADAEIRDALAFLDPVGRGSDLLCHGFPRLGWQGVAQLRGEIDQRHAGDLSAAPVQHLGTAMLA